MKAAEWIDRAKVAQGWPSDYRAAKELGLTRQAVSTYRSKPAATLDDVTAYRLAQVLHMDPAAIVLDQTAERTKSEEVRAALLAAASRLCILCKVPASVTRRALARRVRALSC